MLVEIFCGERLVAYARNGGRELVPGLRPDLEKLQFKDVTLSDEERRNLNYENYEDALAGRELKVVIRNSDGSKTTFGGCKADLSGYPRVPTTETLESLDLYRFRT